MCNVLRSTLLAVWLCVTVCLSLIPALAVTDEQGAGWGGGTKVVVYLETCMIDAGDEIDGTVSGKITISPAPDNTTNVKLYGRRDGSLYPDEPYWQMEPCPTYVQFSADQSDMPYEFPFGRAYFQPPHAGTYTQVFIYSATINMVPVPLSEPAYLTVVHQPQQQQQMLDETLYDITMADDEQ